MKTVEEIILKHNVPMGFHRTIRLDYTMKIRSQEASKKGGEDGRKQGKLL